jgi:hypothetical protein
MWTTEKAEGALIESIVAEQELGTPVYTLLRMLCSALPINSITSPDAVFFVYSSLRSWEATAVGIAVMIQQTVEPLRVKFALGESRTTLASGWLYLGDTTREVWFGSREHGKLEKELIANPEAEYPWKLILQRTAAEWRVASDAG